MENLLKIAIIAALETGREIMHIYLDPKQDFGIENKSDNSPLTRADKAAHKCILRHLDKTDIPILSEEGKLPPYGERKAWHRVWVVDPLDGTKEFIKKNGEFTVNIGLVEDGSPVAGVVYVPVTGVIYFGIVGFGAWKGKASVSSQSNGPIDGTLLEHTMIDGGKRVEGAFIIATSRSHLSLETEDYIKQMRKEHKLVQVISSGSSVKMCLVAENIADVYPRFAPTMEWDTAAGDAIVRAAGKAVVDARTGQPLTYNKPDLHNPWFIVQ